MTIENEPTLDTIDDYNNNETEEKRKTIRLIIGGLVLFAIFLGYLRFANDTVSDYIGTTKSPGINVSRD